MFQAVFKSCIQPRGTPERLGDIVMHNVELHWVTQEPLGGGVERKGVLGVWLRELTWYERDVVTVGSILLEITFQGPDSSGNVRYDKCPQEVTNFHHQSTVNQILFQMLVHTCM